MEQLDEQSKLRKYILSDISDEIRSAIEERLLTDDEYFEELSMTEENLIQDYVDENLDSPERERFEKCFLQFEENRQKVKFARALRKYVNENETDKQLEKTPNFFSSLIAFFSAPVPIALSILAIVAIAGFFVWKSSGNRSEVLVALNKAYKNERPIESRISDFDYAPTKNTRGEGDKTNKTEFELAKILAFKAVSEKPTAENLHALGRVYLSEKEFDKAIKQFEKAVKLSPDNAKIHNDLGVALMEKAKLQTEGKLENLGKANEEFAKAIELDKNLLDAYFNTALCLQIMPGSPQATEAWQQYLKLDSTSAWAEEARKNLEAIETQKPISKTKEEILRDFLVAKQTGDHEKAWQTLSRNREMITGKLIPQQLAFLFVEAKSNGDEAKAKEYLEALVYTGKLEEEKSGDLYWKDIANFYSTVSNDKILILKRAQELVLEGYELSKKNKYEKALSVIESAQSLFLKTQNIFEPKLLDFIIGYCKNRLNLVNESNNRLAPLANICRKNSYKWLHSQTLTWLAVNSISTKEFSKSIAYNKDALKLAKETDDLLTQQKAFSQLAESYSIVGQFSQALNYNQQNLELDRFPETSLRQKWRNFKGIAKVFYEAKYFQTSILYAKEALAVGLDQPEEKTFAYTSYIDLALIQGSVGNLEEAFQFIEKGQKAAENFTDAGLKEKSVAYTNLQLAHLKRQTKNYREATENYKQSINFYDSQQFQVDSYDAHRGLLLNYLAEKNDVSFQEELPNILNLFNEYRAKIIEEQNRNSFFDNEQSVYDIAIDFEFEKANYTNAFDYSEESRSRSLLDLQHSIVEISNEDKKPEIKFSPNIIAPFNLAQIQAEMSENVQLVEYTVLQEKILIWLITKDNFITAKAEISSEILQDKVLRYLELVSKNTEPIEQRQISAELYQILINPIKENLDSTKEICLIPDKVLFNLPFATLYLDKYLIEDYKISYAPSANVFIICSKKTQKFEAKTNETLLSIGNPTFNQSDFEDLPNLPTATQEATEIAKFYVDSVVFTEKDATKQHIKENLNKSDVIHFAGHYLVDEHSPLLSGLIFAGKEKEDSKLANYEIIGEKLSNTRLIVLSACQTGIEKYYNGEGMIGAARTFLATGVPLVVASQWSVDSDATKDLMVRFHRYRKKENLSTVEALRQAQLDMLNNDKFKQPYYWAAFMTLGGYAQF